jgi:uncharacterized membrane-anchored protein
MAEEMSADRARGVRVLLMVTLGFAVVLLVLAILILLNGDAAYGTIVLVIAGVLGALGLLALRAVRDRAPQARRLAVWTGVFLVVLSIPLMPILIGMLTVLAGIGLLVVVFAPERSAS